MKGYAELEVFTPAEVELLRQATAMVALLDDDPEIRCHELARAIGQRLGLTFKDGFYGFVEHTWLWTTPYEGEGEQLWRLPNILDVYVPGELPQVQLIHTTTALPMPYRFGPPRDDIRGGVVRRLLLGVCAPV